MYFPFIHLMKSFAVAKRDVVHIYRRLADFLWIFNSSEFKNFQSKYIIFIRSIQILIQTWDLHHRWIRVNL